MQPQEFLYMYPVSKADPAGEERHCQIREYTIRALPLRISEWQKKYLIGGNGLLQKLFRLFCLRKRIEGQETVVLSEKAQELLPRPLWYPCMKTDFPSDLQEVFALEQLSSVLKQHKDDTGGIALMVIAPPEGLSQEMLTQLMQELEKTMEEETPGTELKSVIGITDLLFYTCEEEEKEWIEDKLDDYLEETGVAGMCYLMEKGSGKWENPLRKRRVAEFARASSEAGMYINEMAETGMDIPGMQADQMAMTGTADERESGDKHEKEGSYKILLDFSNRPLKELWDIDFYIAGRDRKSRKEIRRLTGRRISVADLRNYLDRAFSSTL